MTALNVQVGDRIRLIAMGDDPCPVEAGTTGTVRGIFDFRDGRHQLHMAWDVRRSLHLVIPEDTFEVIGRPAAPYFREA